MSAQNLNAQQFRPPTAKVEELRPNTGTLGLTEALKKQNLALSMEAWAPTYHGMVDQHLRKNSRLHTFVPPDILAIKGQVLKSTISHHEVQNMRNLGFKRKEILSRSMTRHPSIQPPKSGHDMLGLVMQGVNIEALKDLEKDDANNESEEIHLEKPTSKQAAVQKRSHKVV